MDFPATSWGTLAPIRQMVCHLSKLQDLDAWLAMYNDMLWTTTSTWANLDDGDDDFYTLESLPQCTDAREPVGPLSYSLIALLADDLLRLHLVGPAVDERLVLPELADLVLPTLLAPVAEPRLFRDHLLRLALVRDDDPGIVTGVDLGQAGQIALRLLLVGVEWKTAKVGRRMVTRTGLVEGARVAAVRSEHNV